MTSLKVRQIHSKIRGMFENDLDLTEISDSDPERDVKILLGVLQRLLSIVQLVAQTAKRPMLFGMVATTMVSTLRTLILKSDRWL